MSNGLPQSELPGYPRAETIKCPRCNKVQAAQVRFEDGAPFPAYVHDCEACGYTIMESEWEVVPTQCSCSARGYWFRCKCGQAICNNCGEHYADKEVER